ncbi:MAG: hypothetical protein LBF68_04225 [Christensenellaceae bacterium]|nr:hypothetical protein [Christensenellaceae bacterium]
MLLGRRKSINLIIFVLAAFVILTVLVLLSLLVDTPLITSETGSIKALAEGDDTFNVSFSENSDENGNYVVTYSAETQGIPFQYIKFEKNDQPITLEQSDVTITYHIFNSDGSTTVTTNPTNAATYKVTFNYDDLECEKLFIITKATPEVNIDGRGITTTDEINYTVDYHVFYGFESSRIKGVKTSEYFYVEELSIEYDFLTYDKELYGYGNDLKKPPVNSSGESYSARFVFKGNDNYESIDRTINFTVKPTMVHAVAASATVRYTGSPINRTISYYSWGNDNTTINNEYITQADATFTIVHRTADGAYVEYPTDAGDYYIESITSKSENYVYATASGYPTTSLMITKQTLTIGVRDLTTRQGELPNFVYTYSGFVNNESETVLDLSELRINDMPDINVPGKYVIKPTGAKSNNYQFGYKSGNLTVYAISLSTGIENSEKQNLVINGTFQPGTQVDATAFNPDSAESKRVANALRDAQNIFFLSDVQTVYQFLYTSGGVVSTGVCTISVSGVETSNLFSYKLAIVDSNGNVVDIKNFALKNGVLSFNSFSSGYIVLYRDSLTTYVIIAIIGLIVIAVISLIIANNNSYKDTKAMIQAKKEKAMRKQEEANVNKKYKW